MPKEKTMVESTITTYFATGGRAHNLPWLRFMGQVLGGVAVGPRGEILYANPA